MKSIILLLFTTLIGSPTFAQRSGNLEETADRIADQAERFAENLERQLERNAVRWEAAANRIAQRFERNWNGDLTRLPKTVSYSFCPDGAFLGIESNDISKEKAKKLGYDNPYGSIVTKVHNNTAAKAAGLQTFDYLYGIDEQRASNNQSFGDILEDYKPGEEVTLHLIRKGQKQSLKVKLGSYDDFDSDEDDEQAFLGISPDEMEDSDDMDGVTVEIVNNSAAEEIGLKDGDVISAINQQAILDWDDVEVAIGSLRPGDPVEVRYKRNGEEGIARGSVKSHQNSHRRRNNDDWNVDLGDLNLDLNFDWNRDDRDNQDENSGDGAFLGIYGERISEEKARRLGFDNPYGSYLTGIVKNTAAEKAGLQPFDYIFGIEEYRVGENQTLGNILRKFKPGDKATIHLIRKSKKTSVNVTFGSHDDARHEKNDSCEDPFFGINQFYEYGESLEGRGVRISPVNNTTAAEMGLEKGDVITSINGYPMIDWQDITTAIEMLKPGETITVEYLRDGKTMKGSKPIKSYAETKKCENCDCGGDSSYNYSYQDKKGDNHPYNYNNSRGKGRSSDNSSNSPRLDVNSAKASVEEVSATEMSNLPGAGSGSNLTVERLSLSPNPNRGMFKLEFNLPSLGETVVNVFNANGRSIYEYELGRFSGEFSDDVDISQNGPGNYFLQVKQDGKRFMKKIVLTKK